MDYICICNFVHFLILGVFLLMPFLNFCGQVYLNFIYFVLCFKFLFCKDVTFCSVICVYCEMKGDTVESGRGKNRTPVQLQQSLGQPDRALWSGNCSSELVLIGSDGS